MGLQLSDLYGSGSRHSDPRCARHVDNECRAWTGSYNHGETQSLGRCARHVIAVLYATLPRCPMHDAGLCYIRSYKRNLTPLPIHAIPQTPMLYANRTLILIQVPAYMVCIDTLTSPVAKLATRNTPRPFALIASSRRGHALLDSDVGKSCSSMKR